MSRNDSFQYPGQYQESTVSRRVQQVAADTEVDLGVECSMISIWLEGTSSEMHLTMGNVECTTGHAKLPAGGSYVYQGPPIRKFHVLPLGAAGFFNVMAH